MRWILILMAMSCGAMAESDLDRSVRESRRDAMESLGQASRSIGETMRSAPKWEPPKSEVYDPGPMRWRDTLPPSRCRRYPDGLLVCM